MIDAVAFTLDGHAGALAARTWVGEAPRYVALLCHGYGEHCGRYEYVAAHLVADGAPSTRWTTSVTVSATANAS